MDEVKAFEKYENGERLLKKEVDLLRSYACRQLISWTPNREFFEYIYNECSALQFVIEWREKNNLCPVARRGEKI